MRFVRSILWIFLVSLTLSGCDDTFLDPFENEQRYFTVYGFLDPLQARQTVRVIPVTRFAEDIQGPAEGQAFIDARVYTRDLTDSTSTLWTHELKRLDDGSYIHLYHADFLVQPGHTYRLDVIRNAVERQGKSLVVYLSMGFGNPYGDEWSPEIVGHWSSRLHNELGVLNLALSDTVGAADPLTVEQVCRSVVEASPSLTVGAHLHGKREDAVQLAAGAWRGGCRRLDGALGGYGGCPMAKDDLVGNLPTELLMQAPPLWGGLQRLWDAEALEEAQHLLARLT